MSTVEARPSGAPPSRLVQIQNTGPGSRPGRGIDLNANVFTRTLLTNRFVQPTVQLFTVTVFFLALYQALAGPQNPGENFGSTAFFGLWWAPVMLISLLLVGRAWCYFCPIGAVTNFLQRFSLNRRFPTFRKPKLTVLGVQLSILSLTAVTFLAARLPLYKFGVSFTPWKTGIYFLAFFAIAVGLTLIFRQRVFCRYVCPATGVMSVTSRLSPIALTQDRDRDVPDCMTAEFRSPYLSVERRCVACMNCTTGQESEPVRLQFRWPGSAAVKQGLLIGDEALIALIIWAVFPVDHVLGSEVIAKLGVMQSLPAFWAAALPYLSSVALTILGFGLVSWIAAKWSGLKPAEAFVRFAFAYAPLGIAFQLGQHVVPGLMEEGGGLINRFFAGLGVHTALPTAWASEATVQAWLDFSSTWGLWLGVAWGAIIAWAIARDMTRSSGGAIAAALPHLAFMSGVTTLVVGHLAM